MPPTEPAINDHLRAGLARDLPAGYNYLKIKVRATGIIPAGEVQYSLFSHYDHRKQQALSHLMDDINARYGRGALRVAAKGDDQAWKMKQDYLSKQYTTDRNNIIVAK